MLKYFVKDGDKTDNAPWVVKCIDWKAISDQTQTISPKDYLNNSNVLLYISSNAETVFTAKACTAILYVHVNELLCRANI